TTQQARRIGPVRPSRHHQAHRSMTPCCLAAHLLGMPAANPDIRMMQGVTFDLQIAPLSMSTLEEAAAVLEVALGEGYVTADDLAPYVSRPGHLALVATDGESVLGAVTADLLAGAGALLAHIPADMHDAVL